MKYRAWNKKEKIYMPYEAVGLAQDGAVIDWETGGEIDKNEIDIELCTGETDCNGDLIYEGDIVQLVGTDIHTTVVFVKGAFRPGFADEEPFEDFSKWQIIGNTHIKGFFKWEIVGNIHEEKPKDWEITD